MDHLLRQQGKVNGRWTKQEHLLFLEGIFSPHTGLRLHGKNWKKIEQLITTRTGSQIRSHAQKFFMKQTTEKRDGNTGSEEGEMYE